jgi:hypothetical protein
MTQRSYLVPDYEAQITANTTKIERAEKAITDAGMEIQALEQVIAAIRAQRSRVAEIALKYPPAERARQYDRLCAYRDALGNGAELGSLLESTKSYFEHLDDWEPEAQAKLASLRAQIAARAGELKKMSNLLHLLQVNLGNFNVDLKIDRFRQVTALPPSLAKSLRGIRFNQPEIKQARLQADKLRAEIAALTPHQTLKIDRGLSPVSYPPLPAMRGVKDYQVNRINRSSADIRKSLLALKKKFDVNFPKLGNKRFAPRKRTSGKLRTPRTAKRMSLKECLGKDLGKVSDLLEKFKVMGDLPDILKLLADRDKALADLEVIKGKRAQQIKEHEADVQRVQRQIKDRARIIEKSASNLLG